MAKTSLNHIKYSHLTNFLEFLPKKKKKLVYHFLLELKLKEIS